MAALVKLAVRGEQENTELAWLSICKGFIDNAL